MFLDLPVKFPEEPGVILDVNPEGRIVSVRLGDGGETISRSPRFPKRLITLLILIRDVIGFGVFKNKTIEAQVENSPNECVPVFVDARPKRQHLSGAPGVDFRVITEMAPVK